MTEFDSSNYPNVDQGYQQPQGQQQPQQQYNQQPQQQYMPQYVQPIPIKKQFGGTEKAISFALGFFLGFIGVLIAYLIYKDDTYEKPEAIKWSLIAVGIELALVFVFAGITTCSAISLVGLS